MRCTPLMLGFWRCQPQEESTPAVKGPHFACFVVGVQAKVEPQAAVVDLPSERAAQRAGRKGRSDRQTCANGRGAAKSVNHALPLR